MQVKDIMTSKVLSVEANTSVFRAIRSMLQHKISGLPVVNADGALVGIVTEGDFLRRAETATERRRPRWLEFLMGPGRLADEYVHTHTRRVADVMTPDPYTVTEATPLEDVVRIMEKHRIKRLPVLRGKASCRDREPRQPAARAGKLGPMRRHRRHGWSDSRTSNGGA